jgi:hypothetical protein
MSQASLPTESGEEAPFARELNKDVNHFSGENATVQEVIEEYTDLPPEKQRGRPVLSHQIPKRIAEVLQTSLPLTPIYRYSRETESTTAWRIAGTTKALIRSNDTARDSDPWYMLPPLGETQLDLRWMMLQSDFREIPFTIEYLPDETIRTILKTTRPEHRAAIETLLTDYLADRP